MYSKKMQEALDKVDDNLQAIIDKQYAEMAKIAKGSQYEDLIDEWHKNMTKAIKEAK